jgi:hypothetical protein
MNDCGRIATPKYYVVVGIVCRIFREECYLPDSIYGARNSKIKTFAAHVRVVFLCPDMGRSGLSVRTPARLLTCF